MALTLETPCRDMMAYTIKNSTDSDEDVTQPSPQPGKLNILAAGNVLLASFTLNDIAFSAPASGTITATLPLDAGDATVITDGVAATCELIAGFNAGVAGVGPPGGPAVGGTIFSGVVTDPAGGGDAIISEVALTAGQSVTLIALTITIPS